MHTALVGSIPPVLLHDAAVCSLVVHVGAHVTLAGSSRAVEAHHHCTLRVQKHLQSNHTTTPVTARHAVEADDRQVSLHPK
jgi:hypothetical protein